MTEKQPRPPYVFDEFFASGKEECISPFLTRDSKKWGKYLSVKTALLSAFFLVLAFAFQFTHINLSYFFLLLVYVLSGTPALIGAIEDILSLDINIDVLMTLAALLSVVIGSGMEGALLLVLFEFSGAMEMAVTQKTKSALISLHSLAPSKATVLAENGHTIETAIQEVPLGALILIKAGEIVPLDGKVTQGSSFVNLSHLTGESTPLAKGVGDEVPAGARNLDGALTLQVHTLAQDSTLNKIIHMIKEAIDSKPQLEQWIDKFGKRYAPSIILLTTAFAIFLPWIFPIAYLGPEGAIYRALAFLIAASPCALVIATPTAYLSAISSCAKKGILLKGGAILDALASCKHVAFDKTGTLTTGKLRCLRMQPLTEEATRMDLNYALSIAGSLERLVKHPMAEAIVSLAQEKGLSLIDLDSFLSIPGSGLEAKLNNTNCYIGKKEWILSKTSLPLEFLPSTQGSTQTYLLLENALFVFHFQDEIRPDTHRLIKSLQNTLKMTVCMLTGDHRENALPIAQGLGISEVLADLKPQDKLDRVAKLSHDHGLIMVGDGINDAPALARATVGISLGNIGSASAIDAADVIFLQDDISSLDWLVKKSHQSMRIIKQNCFLALGVICFVTTPALLGWVPLWLAVVLHEGGTVLVGLNSLRLLRRK
ncbi:MAG: heavy metal translocating P-type ATPase [Rhabdochlamydiaceae bacterium]|nr:heavy metal translocating P-type ATPase [Rhabdochlamydiaceae bacterium]